MTEYIERETIAKLFDSECRGECVVCPHDDRGDCTLMNQIPTADVQPVKHGRWVELDYDKSFCKCSECGVNWEWNIIFYCNFNYCPSCGAIMDGGDF